MNSTATPDNECMQPVTALDLVNIAGVLIDQQDVGDNPDESTRTFRTGVKAGIVSMCKASTSAINAFGALSLSQLAGPAPAGQQCDTHSNQVVTPQSGGPDQRSTTTQVAGIIVSDRQHANLILGEKRAGSIIHIATGVIYDVMLMPGELESVTWAEAKAQITAAGGDLPTRDEMLMLYKLLGSSAFREDQYWTHDKVQFIGEPEDSICYFSDGYFEITDATDRMHARGVRRICVGDVAQEGSDPIDDSYVVVRGPEDAAAAENSSLGCEGDAVAVLRRLDGYMAASGYDADHPWRREIAAALPRASAGQAWGLAQAPAAGITPAPAIPHGEYRLTAAKMDKLVNMQRRACDILEATGVPSQVEAAGDLRSATGDLWDAVAEQITINGLAPTLSDWMSTPAGLLRVLVGALRAERIEGNLEYNDGIQDCVDVVTALISDGAVADKGIDVANIPSSASEFGTGLRQQWAELSALAPKVDVDKVVDVLTQFQKAGENHGKESTVGKACWNASVIIEALLLHGAGVVA